MKDTLIRWWRVKRAHKLLQFTFGLKYADSNCAVARFAVQDMAVRGHAAPAALLSAIKVIETAGVERPSW